ncbi:MAG: hypothetical protein M5U01_28005 [Ardenticatenaceae bacterium]|nr:hypothetical protein [Ardenticatenaceae bacterium]HBY92744.1 hypothetical protein [Chloroflexota bacterium]
MGLTNRESKTNEPIDRFHDDHEAVTHTLFAALALLGVVLSACRLPDPPTVQPGGRLAYIGGDGNVYVTTADRRVTAAVTDDATAPPEGPGLSYHRLAWSPDGRLAFAVVTRSGNKAHSTLYVVDAVGEPARPVGQSDDHFVIYIAWSPVACPGRPACRRLAYLIEERDGVGLHLVELEGDRLENRLVGVGRPFYFSWAPDGRRILWHTGGARRHRPEARIALYDVERDHVETLPQAPGLFLAPAWSPQGHHWLSVEANEALDQLQLFGDDQPRTVAAAQDAEMSFAWSPDGSRVAYAVRARSDDPFYGPIHLFDLATGESLQVTDGAFQILAFFWAPDGRRIAYLTRLALPDAAWMQWRVYDVAGQRDRGYTAFQPSSQMRFVIHSFNQYAQSDHFWSPDGRYLVYADRDRALVERVWLVDTWAEKGSDPILVGEGSIGFWSWAGSHEQAFASTAAFTRGRSIPEPRTKLSAWR